jgi:DNA-binding SARP family transcriptional activator
VDTVVDLEQARAALHAAETALRRGAWGEVLGEARVAMEIAARGFLSGEELPWIEGQRRALADLRLHALEATVAAEIGRGRPDLAEREAEQLLALDPLSEEGYRLLMRAVAVGGDTLRLAGVMDACRRALAAQVDARPSPETDRLYAELAANRPA